MDIKASKSHAILDLEQAKRKNANRRTILRLASIAAALETRVAEDLLAQERGAHAAASFLSAASCMKDAQRLAEAARLLERAQVYAETDGLVRVIAEERSSISIRRRPAEIFRRAVVNIRDNEKLRIPQREAYAAAVLHFRHSNEHAIIQLPVGCGKTGTMAILPFGLATGRALVVTPNLEIRRTVAASLDYSSPNSFYRKAAVLCNGGGPTTAILDVDANLSDADGADFVVANVQQIASSESSRWLRNLPPDYFDLILVDEGHHNVAPSWRNVFDHFPRAKVTSLTATPLRSDGQEVEGRRIYHFPIASAIREGYVRDLASRRLEPEEIYFEFRGSKKRHTLQEVLRLREEDWFSKGVALSPTCNKNIVDASIQCMRELRENGLATHQIIAAACSIDHAKAIRSLYAERGLRADVIHSRLGQSELLDVRARLAGDKLDAIVQVQMLGEGADYPNLAVAAIFRPYRHLVPYVQFIGRIMRVVRRDAPGHPDNRGYVVSHIGLNVDRWWDDLKHLDGGDQLFFEELCKAERDFLVDSEDGTDERRFRPPMEVLQEVVERYVEVSFLPEVRKAVIEDIIHALGLRGVELETLGLSREDLAKRLEAEVSRERTGKLFTVPVQPQRERQEARRRLYERVQSAAGEVLRRLGMKVSGFDLPRLMPGTGSTNNIGAAIVLLNKEVQRLLGTRSAERDLLSLEELEDAYRAMDDLVDTVIVRVKSERDRGGDA